MNASPIAELVQPIGRADPRQLGLKRITYVDIASIDREIKNVSAASCIDASTAPSRARQRLSANDILISTVRPNLNAVAMVPSHLDGAIGSTGFCVLRADTARLSPEYLFYFSQTTAFVSRLTRIANGASYPAVSDDDVLETIIPLPPTTEQAEIADLLKEADRVRRMRRYALQMSDECLPAAFLEMFGDPVRNPKGWPTDVLESVSAKITDGEHLNPTFVTQGVPIVMAEQVEDSGVNLSSCKLVSVEDFAKFVRKCEPKRGDILLVSRGATIGRTCVVNTDKSFCLMGSVILVKPDSSLVDSSFLAAQLKSNSFLNVLRATSGSSAQQAIYIADLRDKRVIVPPLSHQKKYSSMAEQNNRLRVTYVEALRQAEHLFQTLLHQAFNPQ
jgi:type I restriction enzyme S subunit